MHRWPRVPLPETLKPKGVSEEDQYIYIYIFKENGFYGFCGLVLKWLVTLIHFQWYKNLRLYSHICESETRILSIKLSRIMRCRKLTTCMYTAWLLELHDPTPKEASILVHVREKITQFENNERLIPHYQKINSKFLQKIKDQIEIDTYGCGPFILQLTNMLFLFFFITASGPTHLLEGCP